MVATAGRLPKFECRPPAVPLARTPKLQWSVREGLAYAQSGPDAPVRKARIFARAERLREELGAPRTPGDQRR